MSTLTVWQVSRGKKKCTYDTEVDAREDYDDFVSCGVACSISQVEMNIDEYESLVEFEGWYL